MKIDTSSLLAHISSAFHTAIASAASALHDHVEPWLANFLKTTIKKEVDAVIPLAASFVAEAVPALVKAISTGDFKGYADAQWDAVVATAEAAKDKAIETGLNSVATAVQTLISSHPDVIAASIPIAAAPAPAKNEPDTKEGDEDEEDESDEDDKDEGDK